MTGVVRSVYVHAPFCARRCVYCDFAVTVDPQADPGPWREALAAEWTQVAKDELFSPAPALSTLYVGGGTPSMLGPAAMDILADVLGRERLAAVDLEWTAEANPESFTPELASRWLEAGVNRVSLGVQSFHEPTLRWMGRLHGAEGAERAVRTAKSIGFTNISVDLIFGLPAKLGRSWEEDLERTLALRVPHVSLYGLSIEAGTPLGRAVAEGREGGVDEARYRNEFLIAAERLTRAGYVHYEVSNFALPGLVSRHNSAYWDGRPYLGLGNGAHSYRHPVRRWNVRDWGEYRARVLAGRPAEESREILSSTEASLERVWLGLRTRAGLPRVGLGPRALELFRTWNERGLAEPSGDRIRLTPLGWLELDRLAVELDEADAEGGRVGADTAPA